MFSSLFYRNFLRNFSGIRYGATRCAIYVFLPAMLLAGAASSGPFDRFFLGELHNSGVRYVLERLDRVPAKGRMNSSLTRLTLEYCATLGRQCSPPAIFPTFPLDTNRIINSSVGSRALKAEFRSLFRAIERSRNIPELDASLAAVEKEASGVLTAPDYERFSSVLSIAKSSARLWAPTSLGGESGGGIKLPAGGGSARPKIDWKEVAEADAMGCIATLEVGCVAGAIIASVANIIYQVVRS